MVKINPKAVGKTSSSVIERRGEERNGVGKMVNALLLDPASRSYVPFKAMLANISETGIQLAMKKGAAQVEEGTKIMIQPPSTKDLSGKSREVVVIWSKEQGEFMTFGCMYI